MSYKALNCSVTVQDNFQDKQWMQVMQKRTTAFEKIDFTDFGKF
jgi:hypothetical protein